MKALVTGATGLIGSFATEKLIAGGHQVRVLVRRESDRRVLRDLPVEVCFGDLRDGESVKQAAAGMDVVFHAAARMSDWGDRRDFFEDNLHATTRLLEASLNAGVKRFVHVSSTGVLGLKAHHGASEDEPYEGEGYYEETKVEAEKAVLEFGRRTGLPVTVIRPSWTLGPRARRHIPLILDYLQRGMLMMVGRGNNTLTFVDPRDVAEAMVLAALSPAAAGQVYHITNGSGNNTQKDCYTILARELGVRPPVLWFPVGISLFASWFVEKWALLMRWDDAPMCTPIRVKFLGRTRHYSCVKAVRELGYKPEFTLEQSLRDAVAWYRTEQKQHANGRVQAVVPRSSAAGSGSL